MLLSCQCVMLSVLLVLVLFVDRHTTDDRSCLRCVNSFFANTGATAALLDNVSMLDLEFAALPASCLKSFKYAKYPMKICCSLWSFYLQTLKHSSWVLVAPQQASSSPPVRAGARSLPNEIRAGVLLARRPVNPVSGSIPYVVTHLIGCDELSQGVKETNYRKVRWDRTGQGSPLQNTCSFCYPYVIVSSYVDLTMSKTEIVMSYSSLTNPTEGGENDKFMQVR